MVVSENNAIQLVSVARAFDKSYYVPITHVSFFKAPIDAFATELKFKDLLSAKEWVESGLAALRLAHEGQGKASYMACKLVPAEQFLQPGLEVLSMRAKYFREITKNEIEEAREMAFLLAQRGDAVHSTTYRTAWEALTGKLEIEAAKQLAKSRLERATKKRKGRGGAESAGDSE